MHTRLTIIIALFAIAACGRTAVNIDGHDDTPADSDNDGLVGGDTTDTDVGDSAGPVTCDSVSIEQSLNNVGAQGCLDAWPDNDDDGHGDKNSEPLCLCGVPPHYASNYDDCDDGNKFTYPGAPERCDGIDNACAGFVPADEQDGDHDHYVPCEGWVGSVPGITGGGDCDDTYNLAYPGATEFFDYHDNNCDTRVDECFADCEYCGAGLKACYRLDTLAQYAFVDDSGHGNSGVFYNWPYGEVVDGKVDEAIRFGSTYAYAFSTSELANPRFTISAWINPASLTTNEAGDPAYIVDVGQQYAMYFDPYNGGLTCAFWSNDSDPPSIHKVSAPTSLTVGEFRHVECTYDGSTLSIYVDGKSVSAYPFGTSVRQSDGAPLSLGNWAFWTAEHMYLFQGIIDHVQIFNDARSDDDICHAAGHLDCH